MSDALFINLAGSLFTTWIITKSFKIFFCRFELNIKSYAATACTDRQRNFILNALAFGTQGRVVVFHVEASFSDFPWVGDGA
jgi:hypothetical protein